MLLTCDWQLLPSKPDITSHVRTTLSSPYPHPHGNKSLDPTYSTVGMRGRLRE